MPETYTIMNTNHIATILGGVAHTNTTNGGEHRYEVAIAPENVEIIGTAPLHPSANRQSFRLLNYEPADHLNVDRIIFSPPATIVLWKDGTKTVVKCAKGEPFSEYNGFAAALLKKVFGSNSAVKKIIQRKKQYDASAKATHASEQTTTLEQRFKELVNKYERLKNRAENLNLYLSKVETTFPVTWLALLDTFSDMPGYERPVEKSYGN